MNFLAKVTFWVESKKALEVLVGLNSTERIRPFFRLNSNRIRQQTKKKAEPIGPRGGRGDDPPSHSPLTFGNLNAGPPLVREYCRVKGIQAVQGSLKHVLGAAEFGDAAHTMKYSWVEGRGEQQPQSLPLKAQPRILCVCVCSN